MSLKMRYDKEVDILLVEIAKRPIDHAREMGPVIVHFTKDGKPVALEILEASKFVSKATETSLLAQTQKASRRNAA